MLCSVVWLQIATGLPSRQQKSPESRGVVGKQVLLRVIKEGVEIFKGVGMIKCYPNRCFILIQIAKSCGHGSLNIKGIG